MGAQADSILALPKANQVNALYAYFEKHISTDTSIFLPRLEEMQKSFKQAGRKDLARATWIIRIEYLVQKSGDEIKNIDLIDNSLEYAIRHDWEKEEAELYILKGIVYHNFGRPVSGFTFFTKGYELMKQVGFEKFPRFHVHVFSIGYHYLNAKAYDQAISYIRQSASIPLYRADSTFATVVYNTLGICYMRQMQYDSAIIAWKQAYEYAVRDNMQSYIGLIQGNIGYAYFKLGNDEAALPLLEKDFNLSIAANEINSAMNASLALSHIYLKKGLQDKANYHMRFAGKHVRRNDDNAMKSYYENLSELRRMTGDYKQGMDYRDSAAYYQARMDALEEKDILERARLELEVEKHANSITTLESLRKRQILVRNGMLLFLALTGIVILSFIQRKYILHRKKLEQARRELELFTTTIREKNAIIETFNQEIESLRHADQHLNDERSHHLTALMNAHILTEDDWKEFKILFDKVHPFFFGRLKEKLPDLSAAETRMLALSKLHLAPKEMASMLGISYDAIMKSRQRLRKKINLPEEGTLEELLKEIV